MEKLILDLHKQLFLGTIREHIDLEMLSHDKNLELKKENRKKRMTTPPPPPRVPLNHMSALVYNLTGGEENDV